MSVAGFLNLWAARPRTGATQVSEEQVAFATAVLVAYRTPELMTEYRRLTGSTLGLDERTPIVRMIDEAAGHDPWSDEYEPFFRFVRDVIWLPAETRRKKPDSIAAAAYEQIAAMLENLHLNEAGDTA